MKSGIAGLIRYFLDCDAPFMVQKAVATKRRYKKILIVLNPVSNRRRLVKRVSLVAKALLTQGYSIMFVRSTASGELIVNPRNYGSILIAGGDGTISNFLNYYSKQGGCPPIGIIPVGTTNELGQALGITTKNYADVILRGSLLQNDSGVINDNKCFCYVVACGVLTDVTYKTNQFLKRVFGVAAYFFTAIFNLKFKPLYLQIDIDNGTVTQDGKYWFFSITNSCTIGGATIRIKNLPKGWANDGKLEYIFVKKPESIYGAIMILIHAIMGQIYSDKHVISGSCREMNVTSDSPLTVTVDGEPYTMDNRLAMTVTPRKYYVSTPSKYVAGMY